MTGLPDKCPTFFAHVIVRRRLPEKGVNIGGALARQQVLPDYGACYTEAEVDSCWCCCFSDAL